MPGNPTLKKRSLCDLVCDEIQRAILRGQYRPGDRLPSEDRLCEIYSVGRGSIREALKRLEIVGLINIVHGRGIEVAESNAMERRLRVLETNLILSGPELSDLLEVRRVIERAAVSRLAKEECLVADGLESLLASFSDGLAMVSDGGELADRFLATAVDSSGNVALNVIYESVRNLTARGYRHHLHAEALPGGILDLCRATLLAIRSRDEKSALLAVGQIHEALGDSLIPEEAGA